MSKRKVPLLTLSCDSLHFVLHPLVIYQIDLAKKTTLRLASERLNSW